MSTLNGLVPNPDLAQDLLTDVTTTSKVARWRWFVWIVACGIYALDVLFDLLKIDMEDIAKKSRFGTLPWYVQKSFEFQFGDVLIQDSNKEWKYATINTANQIIKRAASQEGVNLVVLKVAKLVGGVASPLSSTELSAYDTYIKKLKPPGINVSIITDVADELQLYITVNYDPLVLSSTGELLSTPGSYPVIDAVNNYIDNIDFNGVFELMTAVDYLQTAQGVKSVYITSALARYGANPFVAFTQKYLPNAGHLKIDPANDLTVTTTYTPYV